MILLRSLGLAVACSALGLTVAAETAPPLEPVGERQGLATGILSTVFVDREGFLWIATAPCGSARRTD